MPPPVSGFWAPRPKGAIRSLQALLLRHVLQLDALSIGDTIWVYFYGPEFRWFEGKVRDIKSRMSRAGNVIAEFEDGRATVALRPDNYGADETWVIVRSISDDDDHEDGSSGSVDDDASSRSPRSPRAPNSATKAPKRRRKATVDSDETDGDN